MNQRDVKKLENIPKTNIFEVPEGYFDRLPGIIQARTAKPAESERPFYVIALRYAVPALVLVFSLVFVLQQNNSQNDVEKMLAAVSTEALTSYLIDSDLSTDELLDAIDLAQIDTDQLGLETMSIFDMDYDELEELSNELESQYF